MKKLIPLLFAVASAIPAATIVCTPENGNVTNVTQVYNCAGQGSVDSLRFTNLDIFVISNGNVTGAISGLTFSALLSNPSNSAGYALVPDIPLSCVATGSPLAGCTTGSQSASSSTPLPDLDVIPDFTVTLTGTPGLNSLPIDATVAYSVTEVDGVPEPGTIALLGSALLALGFVRRRG